MILSLLIGSKDLKHKYLVFFWDYSVQGWYYWPR